MIEQNIEKLVDILATSMPTYRSLFIVCMCLANPRGALLENVVGTLTRSTFLFDTSMA